MAIYTLKDGLVTQTHVFTDRLGFLQQLGVLPADISALTSRKAHPDYVQFIDSFTIPKASWKEFAERVKINRDFIKTLPGFIEDAAYERTDEQGNIHYITIAIWQNETALKQAKEAVQTEYKQQGFNPAEFMTRLKVTMDRGIYTEDLINR
jgi:heme-degrading monooxygenase HmoA